MLPTGCPCHQIPRQVTPMTKRIIDYTKYRKGSKPRGYLTIDYCPKCGRKGEAAKYKNGAMRYFHIAEDSGYGLTVTDACFIKQVEDGAK